MFTISDLKKHLGPGLGLRKNKYLLEIPVPGIEGEKINVLARSAGLPERNISTTTLWRKGRRYNVRGETDYIGTYEVSIVDDSDMDIRRVFDNWLKTVDDSKKANQGIFGGASYESGVGKILGNVKSGLAVANQIKNAVEDPTGVLGGWFLGTIDGGQAAAVAKYQTDINIWQLSSNGTKVYGYKLQNAFPSQVGIVQLDDGDENTLSEFSVTFTFSEFLPLENQSMFGQITGTLLGDDFMDAAKGFDSLTGTNTADVLTGRKTASDGSGSAVADITTGADAKTASDSENAANVNSEPASSENDIEDYQNNVNSEVIGKSSSASAGESAGIETLYD